MSRRLLALTLAGLLWVMPLTACASEPKEAAGEPLFSDVPVSAGYAQAVAWCKEQGLMDGVGGGKFDPEGTLTRAMLATVLYRAADKPAVTEPLTFTDAVAGSWYADALVWANANAIMQGYGGGVFGVDDPVSVEMLEVVVSRRTGGSQSWVGDPAKAGPATRAQVAVALMAALSGAVPAPEEVPLREKGKVLVAYFSCTNTTKAVAEMIAKATGGDLFRIEPAEPYSDADLNYRNDSCRANREQNDPSALPAVAADCVVADWDSYDVVFLGHPIWWGIPPKLMRTFAGQYDWTGKTVVGFCTSGGSSYSNTGLPELTAGANWLDTRRLNGASQSGIDTWVGGLELPTGEEEKEMGLTVTFNGHSYTAVLADNPSAAAFAEHLAQSGGSVVIHAHDYGSFEKVGELGASIVQTNQQIDTVPGDIILYQGSNICLYYATNSWNFTRLGRLEGDLSRLKADLGEGNVDITYTLVK